MMELFEEIFAAVCDEHDADWWEVFDGDLFNEVRARIMDRTGMTAEELEDNDDFIDWTSTMADDL